MKITVNGSFEEIKGPLNLYDFIKNKGLDPEKVVVEYNLEVVSTENYKNVQLKDTDRLELLSFVGGG